MNPMFVYSFDREYFVGPFATRQEAILAGLKRADGYASPVNTIYVGQRVEVDPRALGHARSVLDRMVDRVRDDIGDEADAYLCGLSDAQVTELDLTLEQTIKAWLARHDLLPKTSKVQAITEHPVPTPQQWRQSGIESPEVSLIGESQL